MKIIQIVPTQNGEYTNFFGLTDDNKIVSYSWKKGSWKNFAFAEVATKKTVAKK